MPVGEEIRKIEEEISRTPYNKATQKHIGMLKAKLARLRQSEEAVSKKKSSGSGYGIRKSGDATMVIVGFPSVGKSTLINRLTNAQSKTGAYDFTTLNVIPGVMKYKGAKIQVLDVPGIIEGVSSGRGRGKEILSVVRNADLILMVIEPSDARQLETLQRELYCAGFRIDKKPPDVEIEKKGSGGIDIGAAVKLTKMDKETVKSILQEFKIRNAEVTIKQDVSIDEFVDRVAGNRVYVPSVVVVNKSDLLDESEMNELKKKMPGALFVSSKTGENIDELKEVIWKRLGLMRIYMKKIGKEPDMSEPLILKRKSTVLDVARKIHKEVFAKRLKYARIWGKSARFPGQKKGSDHILSDKDIVELHIE